MNISRILPLGGIMTVVATLLIAPAFPLSAQVNMTGTWALEVNVDGAISNPELVLQQNGLTLTGHYTSAQLGEADVTGTVEGNEVTVTFEASVAGQSAPVEYKGSVDADGVWSGTFDLAGLAGGTFRGTKSGQ
jgi:hypothetical protein